MRRLLVISSFFLRFTNIVMIVMLIVLSGIPSIADARPRGAQLTGQPRATITPLYSNVQVDTDCSGSACADVFIGMPLDNRSLVVGNDGTIYVAYMLGGATYFSKSTNRGQSFSTPQ